MKNRVEEWRELRGLSKKQLAEMSGMSAQQIGRYESTDPSKHQSLSETAAVSLARVLKVQPGDLMPLITDGSVPLPGGIASHEKTLLVGTLAKLFELHTDFDKNTCDRMGMVALKMFQMALDDVHARPFFDLKASTDTLIPDQNKP